MAGTRQGRPDPARRQRQIADLHAQGLGCNAIARKLGCSPSAVSRTCSKLGLTFDRAKVAAANKAHKIDLAERRAAQLERIYGVVDTILDRLEDPFPNALLRGEGGIEQETAVTLIPARDLQQITNSLSTTRRTATELERIDNPAAEAAASMLVNLADRLGIDDTSEPTGSSNV